MAYLCWCATATPSRPPHWLYLQIPPWVWVESQFEVCRTKWGVTWEPKSVLSSDLPQRRRQHAALRGRTPARWVAAETSPRPRRSPCRNASPEEQRHTLPATFIQHLYSHTCTHYTVTSPSFNGRYSRRTWVRLPSYPGSPEWQAIIIIIIRKFI